jgi:hypothetical protein
MRVFQSLFGLGLGLLAGALVWAIAGQHARANEYACMAFVGGILVGISLPAILSAVRKG